LPIASALLTLPERHRDDGFMHRSVKTEKSSRISMQKIFGNVGRQAKVIAAANIHKIE
jgi:hypothetical protein